MFEESYARYRSCGLNERKALDVYDRKVSATVGMTSLELWWSEAADCDEDLGRACVFVDCLPEQTGYGFLG